MIFSELYSVYFITVKKILEAVNNGVTNEKELNKIVEENAFSESFLTILPNLKSGKWHLVNSDFTPVLKNSPSTPTTLLEKRWLKAILLDKRIKLFDFSVSGLENVEPLFTQEDYKIYDKYADGDNFENENYIKNFKLIKDAIENEKQLVINMVSGKCKNITFRAIPTKFEYSVKDDKFRVYTRGSKYEHFNLGRVISCDYYNGNLPLRTKQKKEKIKEVTLEIKDKRNALERVMLHFAHFEKYAEKTEKEKYILKIKYYENDETEVLIRVLSFGPLVKVIAPQSFIDLIKERLILQKSCGI